MKFIIFSVFLITVGMMTNSVVYAAPDFQKNYLTKLDAELNSLVDRCIKSLKVFNADWCTDELEIAWWNDCAFDYDKLDTCKNGKVENFLKSQGRL